VRDIGPNRFYCFLLDIPPLILLCVVSSFSYSLFPLFFWNGPDAHLLCQSLLKHTIPANAASSCPSLSPVCVGPYPALMEVFGRGVGQVCADSSLMFLGPLPTPGGWLFNLLPYFHRRLLSFPSVDFLGSVYDLVLPGDIFHRPWPCKVQLATSTPRDRSFGDSGERS